MSAALPYVPPELLCSVFAQLTLWQRVNATHVCQLWRAVAIDDPRLWSDILFPRPRHLPLHGLFVLLGRTKAAPVSIGSLRVPVCDASSLGKLLNVHLHHLLNLELVSNDGSPLLEVVSELTLPAPLLKSLQLRAIAGSAITLPQNLLSSTAPMLRSVSLDGPDLPLGFMGFSGTTQLVLNPVSRVDPFDGPAICLTDLMPHLSDVVLCVSDRVQYSFGSNHSVDSLTLLGTDSANDLRGHLAVLNHHRIFRIVVAFTNKQSMLEILYGFGTITSIEVRYIPEAHESGLVGVEFFDDKGRSRKFSYVELAVIADVLRQSQTFTESVHTLICPGHLLFVVTHPTQAAYPCLEFLNVVFAHSGPPCSTMSPALKAFLAPMYTPKLHTLFISAETVEDGPLVHVQSAPFVAGLDARPSTPKIARLLIKSVVLLEGEKIDKALCSMAGAVDSIIDSDTETDEFEDDPDTTDEVATVY